MSTLTSEFRGYMGISTRTRINLLSFLGSLLLLLSWVCYLFPFGLMCADWTFSSFCTFYSLLFILKLVGFGFIFGHLISVVARIFCAYICLCRCMFIYAWMHIHKYSRRHSPTGICLCVRLCISVCVNCIVHLVLFLCL